MNQSFLGDATKAEFAFLPTLLAMDKHPFSLKCINQALLNASDIFKRLTQFTRHGRKITVRKQNLVVGVANVHLYGDVFLQFP